MNINNKWPLFCLLWVHPWMHRETALSWYTQRYITHMDVLEHSYNTTYLYLLVSSSIHSVSGKICMERLSSLLSPAMIYAGCTGVVAGANKFLLRGSAGFLEAIGTQLELSTKANSAADWRSKWFLFMLSILEINSQSI